MPRQLIPTNVERAILSLRGHRVMLDEELARLYGVATKRLNEAVKRNRRRFPVDFAFRLSAKEAMGLRSQSATSNVRGGRRTLPWAFTEQGVAMLSSVLGSPKAITVNIGIMRAFVRLRQVLAGNADLARRLELLEARLEKQHSEFGRHQTESERHFRMVFESIRRLLATEEKPEEEPKRVGFILNRIGR